MIYKKRFLTKVSDYFEVARKTESRISSDTDLKLSDILRYYSRDSKAALDLLYRRTRRLADFETENKNLEKARLKHKDEKQAETAQQLAKEKFEKISDLARGELADFKLRRNAMFKKSLTEFVEIQIKHTNVKNIRFFISIFFKSGLILLLFKTQVNSVKKVLESLSE